MPTDKLKGMLSLAAKAGKIVSGETAVRDAIKKNKVVYLIAEKGSSANTTERMGKFSAAYDLPLIFVENLGAGIGHPGRTMAALCDAGFGEAIRKIIEQQSLNGGAEG